MTIQSAPASIHELSYWLSKGYKVFLRHGSWYIIMKRGNELGRFIYVPARVADEAVQPGIARIVGITLQPESRIR